MQPERYTIIPICHNIRLFNSDLHCSVNNSIFSPSCIQTNGLLQPEILEKPYSNLTYLVHTSLLKGLQMHIHLNVAEEWVSHVVEALIFSVTLHQPKVGIELIVFICTKMVNYHHLAYLGKCDWLCVLEDQFPLKEKHILRLWFQIFHQPKCSYFNLILSCNVWWCFFCSNQIKKNHHFVFLTQNNIFQQNCLWTLFYKTSIRSEQNVITPIWHYTFTILFITLLMVLQDYFTFCWVHFILYLYKHSGPAALWYYYRGVS